MTSPMTASATSTPKHYGTYKLLCSTSKDVERLLAFYADNRHDNTYHRGDALFAKQCRDGLILLLEAPDGSLVGSSIAYPYMNNKFCELGTTRTSDECPKGFPLYEQIVGAQIVHQFMFDPPEDRLFADVHTKNHRVAERLVNNVGFADWANPPQEIIEVKCAMVGSREPHEGRLAGRSKYYQCGVEALPSNTARLVATLDQPRLTNKRGDTLDLDMSGLPAVRYGEALLRKLATMDLGPIDQPSANKHYAQTRQHIWQQLKLG